MFPSHKRSRNIDIPYRHRNKAIGTERGPRGSIFRVAGHGGEILDNIQHAATTAALSLNTYISLQSSSSYSQRRDHRRASIHILHVAQYPVQHQRINIYIHNKESKHTLRERIRKTLFQESSLYDHSDREVGKFLQDAHAFGILTVARERMTCNSTRQEFDSSVLLGPLTYSAIARLAFICIRRLAVLVVRNVV